MPILPQSFVIHCTKCNWEKQYRPKSDALSTQDLQQFDACPKCGSKALSCAQPTGFKRKLASFLGR